MKKLLFFLAVFVFSVNAEAQLKPQTEIVTIEQVSWTAGENLFTGKPFYTGGTMRLSDGDVLFFYPNGKVWNRHKQQLIQGDLKIGGHYQIGTYIEKCGDEYNIVSLLKVSDKKIRYVKIREVSAEFSGSINGVWSYGSFLGLIGRGRGYISNEISGGKKTVVNVVFTDGIAVSIDASEDPIWLEAAVGMTAEHYTLGHKDIYKLCF